jgi:fermentation-respiration switch protein FrsA (DUF1100 family)
MDFFLFDGDPASSIKTDYHDLPLYVGKSLPAWVTSAAIEKEIYLTPQGQLIPPADLGNYKEYIHGCFLPAPVNPPKDSCPLAGKNVTFIYTHGNSGDLWRYWYRAVALWSYGANVFIYTYRGYGLSKGETTRAHIKQDVEAAAKYIKGRTDVNHDKVIVYGVSMGALTASYLVGASSYKNTFAGVVLEVGLDKPENIVAQSSGINFPDGYFLEEESYSGLEFIKGTTIPILHMHGQRDERVMIEQAYRYYEILKDRPNYTCYIGKTSAPEEEWVAKASHGNVAQIAFQGEKQLSDYWEDGTNPSHCCVNPFEYNEPQFQEFLEKVGKTTGAEMTRTANLYRDLVTNWVNEVVK